MIYIWGLQNLAKMSFAIFPKGHLHAQMCACSVQNITSCKGVLSSLLAFLQDLPIARTTSTKGDTSEKEEEMHSNVTVIICIFVYHSLIHNKVWLLWQSCRHYHTADINCIKCCHDNYWQGYNDSMNGEAFPGSHGNCCRGNRYHRGWLTHMSAVTQCLLPRPSALWEGPESRSQHQCQQVCTCSHVCLTHYIHAASY